MLTGKSNHTTWQAALGEICAEMLKGNEHTTYVRDPHADIRWEIASYHFPRHEDGNKWGINVFDQDETSADGEDSLIINHERFLTSAKALNWLSRADFIFAMDFFHFVATRIRNLIQEKEETCEQQ